jgi:hypothetical protein
VPAHVFLHNLDALLKRRDARMIDSHIPLSVLWGYSQNANSNALRLGPHFDHLSDCEDCASVLWLCKTSVSVEGVKAKLKSFGIGGFA